MIRASILQSEGSILYFFAELMNLKNAMCVDAFISIQLILHTTHDKNWIDEFENAGNS
jgi:hypothetical protein